VIVDWSAARQPKTGADSIWIMRRRRDGAERVENPPTRHAAKALLGDIFCGSAERGERVLAGSTSRSAIPRFARRLGLWVRPVRRMGRDRSEASGRREERQQPLAVATEFNRESRATPFRSGLSGPRSPARISG